jgi:hypothetical protein
MSPLLTLDESTLFYWTLSNSSRALVTNNPGNRLSAPSVLSDNVKIISRQNPDKVKAEPVAGPSNTRHDSDGGLSDADEIMGEEREFAINSPIKGKKRLTSEVFLFLLFINTIT